MQILSLRTQSYRSWTVDDKTYSSIAKERYKKLSLFDELRTQGCSEAYCLKAINCSRATYFRWKKFYQHQGLSGLEKQSTRPKQPRKEMWSRQQMQQLEHLRKRFLYWDKRKLWKILT